MEGYMPYSGKKATKYNILNYMLNHGDTSKVELAKSSRCDGKPFGAMNCKMRKLKDYL